MRLGIDIGSSTTTAVLTTSGGQRIPVMPDGEPTTPSGVYVDPDTGNLTPGQSGLVLAAIRPDCYVPDVTSHLTAGTLTIAGRDINPLDLYATVLRHISAEASRIANGIPEAVALAIAPTWGPRRRALVRDATQRAGLPDPDLVATPVAVAAQLAAVTGQPPPAGACVLVCDAGAHTLQLTVLQQTDTGGMTILATTTVPNAAGRDIDNTLATQAAQPIRDADPPRWSRLLTPQELPDHRDHHALWQSTRHAKEALRQAPHAVIVLPDPHPPAVIDHSHLTAATHHFHTAIPEHVTNTLTAADVDSTQLQAVILTGGGAHLPNLADILHTTTGHTPVIPARLDNAAADGALHATHTLTETRTRDIHLPRVRLTPRHLIAPLLTGACSFALLIQAIVTADIHRQVWRVTSVRLPLEVVGAAGLLAMLTAFAVAYLAPTTMLSGAQPDTSTSTGTLIRRAYSTAAFLGLCTAAMYGLAVGAFVELTSSTYTRWTLLSALPIAAACLVIAALAPRIPTTRLPTWLHRTRLPLTATLLAAAGIFAMRYANATPMDLVPGGVELFRRIGAAALGIGIALTITTTQRKLLQTVTALILGTGFITVASWGNTPALAIAYLSATTWWAVTITATTISAAYRFPTADATAQTK
ncbi:Hsp70 family protein [Rhizomonospora bruguierae]|uniref:Hsp70 family protein n=1 Tax=Rhizomonospora bruguierae TaxID=1581705 RepID=UPI001BCF5814|nr:Hsp70 family protein [Micromonospora sp. NBRC 107566]